MRESVITASKSLWDRSPDEPHATMGTIAIAATIAANRGCARRVGDPVGGPPRWFMAVERTR